MSVQKLDVKEVAPNISVTKDYKLFKRNKFNRPVRESIVRALMRSFTSVDWGSASPIIVDKKLQIMDGQHRFEARRQLGLPIYYIVKEEYDPVAVLKINTVSTRWNLHDCIEQAAKLGDDRAKAVLQDAAKYEVNLTTIAAAAGINFSRNRETAAMPYDDVAREEARTMFKHLEMFSGYRFRHHRNFILAIRRLMGLSRYSTPTLKSAIETRGGILKPQRSAQDYFLNLIEMYNSGLGNDKCLNPFERR